MRLTSRIYQQHHNLLLVDFLAQRFTYLSKEEWALRITDQTILVNDNPATPDTILKKDFFVSYEVPDFVEPEADLNYSIVYEDEWIVGVNKTGNLLVHKSGKNLTKNLVYQLRHCSNNPAYEGINSVNRLDRETSGVVLFSKDAQTLKLLHKDFAQKNLEKQYCAIVRHPPKNSPLVIDLPIGQDTNSKITYKFGVDHVNGKSAQSTLEIIKAHEDHALLCVKPLTGRTHQIRVHLAAIGCLLVGDKLYGMAENDYVLWRDDPAAFKGKLIFGRQALHCNRVTFTHPIHKKEITIVADLPDDMKSLGKNLGLIV